MNIEGKVKESGKPKPQKEDKTEAKRAELQRKMSKLSELYMSELVQIDDYRQKYNALKNELDSLPEPMPIIPKKKKVELPKDWRSVYDDLSRKGKREFWRSIVREIYLDNTGVVDFDLL